MFEYEDDWSQWSIKHANELINNSSQILFTPLKLFGEQVFGDIELIIGQNSEHDLAKELEKNDRATIVADEIPKGKSTSSKKTFLLKK